VGALAEGFAADVAKGGGTSNATKKAAAGGFKLVAEGLVQATNIHTAATALLPNVPAARQQFFRSHLLLQSAIQRHAVEAVGALANATLASDNAAASADVACALAAIDKLFAAERAAEGTGEWRGLCGPTTCPLSSKFPSFLRNRTSAVISFLNT
jgi:alkylation response protein AidB-like acyl-CoA dehydrogenase